MNLSFWHILLIVGAVLLMFGSSRLPGLGRSFGDAIRGFKKGLNGEIDARDVTPIEESKNEKNKTPKS